ncbi:MAG TPA: hypothetical protein P5013_05730 [Methanoregula sp.]|nr:hypothetical protein [Methanoregula sp.]
MEDLTVGLVETIHNRIIAIETGDCRVLSEANLLQMVFQANLIPECVARAAFIIYFLSAYPAFRERNQRTALELAVQCLEEGGYGIDPVDLVHLERLSEGIIAFTTDLSDIESWLADHTRRMK